MDREILRRHFSALLMNTDNENHLKCNIPIGEGDAMGLSTLQIPKVIGAFQEPKEGIIFFYIEGDCIVEFDDMETDDLINILNTLKEENNIETKVEEDFPTEKLCAKSAVSGQIVNMLINNIINGYGNETFEGWCEDGAVFETAYSNATKEFYEECKKLMKEVAPLVDKLTYDYLA